MRLLERRHLKPDNSNMNTRRETERRIREFDRAFYQDHKEELKEKRE
jgi:hypothetical protein